MEKPENVDAYIEAAPEKLRPKLTELREIIKTIAPTAKEKISYGMPFYDYKGRLIYFAVFKNHIGVYIPPPIIDEHKKELESYKTTKSAIHLPFDKPIPLALMKKLIKAKMKQLNEGNKRSDLLLRYYVKVFHMF
jgi:uncharacterized protein YdhG (YjbR/CyaY superfamily)